MAFQAGTKVDPRLMQADFSGFANAANIRAKRQDEFTKQFTQQLSEGIEKYEKNKEITSMSLAQLEALGASNPDAYSALKDSGGDVSKSIANIEKGDYKQKDVLASLGAMQIYVTERSRQEKAEAAAEDARLQRENLIARTGASERSNQPSPVTYSQVQGVSKLMEEQFGDVKVDESTGETYMKVPKTGDYIPFNTERVPANIPEALKNMPGFEEWKKSKMSPSSQRDYSSLGMSVVK
jgi:hypothetical protein